MEIKQLYYFKTIADEGTISAAARKLNISQPPLSSQMQLLEQELGCILFERGARKIHLTGAGRILYDRACTMLELSQITCQEMQDYRKGTVGVLRIGVVSSVEGLLLERWLLEFHQRFPQIRFEIYEGNTYQLLEQLKANLIELAFVRTPFEPEGLEIKHLLKEPMLAVGKTSFFSEKDTKEKPRILMNALAGKPLIIYRRWEQILTEHFAKIGIEPYYFCKNDDARTSLEWAQKGLGVSIFPASARPENLGPDMSGYVIDAPDLMSEICAVYNQRAYTSAAVKVLLEEILKEEAYYGE